MKVTAIILSHFAERVDNINTIINSLLKGSVKPDRIVVLNDNPEFSFTHKKAICINSTANLPVISRFALGLCFEADRILFIDDDLAVGRDTLKNFIHYAEEHPEDLLGLEGNVLNNESENPYTDGETVDRATHFRFVDVIIRTYFATPQMLAEALYTRELFKGQLPEKSIDDIILCMSNKYQYSRQNIVIPVNAKTDVVELNPYGVGQSTNPEHYINRNLAVSVLR